VSGARRSPPGRVADSVTRSLALLLAFLFARPAVAQELDLSGGVSASSARVARAGIATSALTGPVLGAGGRIGFGRFSLDGQYLEGQLSPESGSFGGKETMAEASVMLRAALRTGFTVGLGPRARAFIASAGTVRWMRMEAQVGYEGEVIPGRARADIGIWQVLSGDVNAQGGSDGGRGGTAGLTVQLPNSPFALRLAYTADRVAFANGASEFVDGVELGLRIRRF
jgi:hypothetical protein